MDEKFKFSKLLKIFKHDVNKFSHDSHISRKPPNIVEINSKILENTNISNAMPMN